MVGGLLLEPPCYWDIKPVCYQHSYPSQILVTIKWTMGINGEITYEEFNTKKFWVYTILCKILLASKIHVIVRDYADDQT